MILEVSQVFPSIKAMHVSGPRDIGNRIQLPREGYAGARQGIPAREASRLC